MAWLGPAIGAAAFEVGDEVREAFRLSDPGCEACFTAGRPGHWYADLGALGRRRPRPPASVPYMAAAADAATPAGSAIPSPGWAYRPDGQPGLAVTLRR
ncbi:MAG: laccase domain-containing protein [Arhodomonas sp.]|nr:laccase domain-containing protein [Arhodomonas sp.]